MQRLYWSSNSSSSIKLTLDSAGSVDAACPRINVNRNLINRNVDVTAKQASNELKQRTNRR